MYRLCRIARHSLGRREPRITSGPPCCARAMRAVRVVPQRSPVVLYEFAYAAYSSILRSSAKVGSFPLLFGQVMNENMKPIFQVDAVSF